MMASQAQSTSQSAVNKELGEIFAAIKQSCHEGKSYVFLDISKDCKDRRTTLIKILKRYGYEIKDTSDGDRYLGTIIEW